MLDTLRRFDYAAAGSPVFIQSFDPGNLRQLRSMTELPLVQLLEHELGILRELPTMRMRSASPRRWRPAPTRRVGALRAGSRFMCGRFARRTNFLPADFKVGDDPAAHGDLAGEIERYLARGIDGFFTDFPAIGVRVRDAAQKLERAALKS